jgi:hypothetical protein
MTALKLRDTTQISDDVNITDRRLLRTVAGDSTGRDQENIFGKPDLDKQFVIESKRGPRFGSAMDEENDGQADIQLETDEEANLPSSTNLRDELGQPAQSQQDSNRDKIHGSADSLALEKLELSEAKGRENMRDSVFFNPEQK